MPIPFVRGDGTTKPPLAAMLRGGRGGEIKLKVYLSVTLLATDSPFDIRQLIPARRWAEMLALPDPETHGARRVADALNWLDQARLIELGRQPGSPPTIKLLSVSGDGTRFVPPAPRWITVPLGLWQEQWITYLSGSALALLLALLELQGGIVQSARAPYASRQRRLEYGLSDDIWTRGRRELERFGVLTVRRIPQGRDFDWERMRNTYWIDIEGLGSAPVTS